MTDPQRLIVVRGLTDARERLARLLAEALPGPTVHVRGDDLIRGWLVRGLPDPRRADETAYRLIRHAAIMYLKEGFNAVVDAPFVGQAAGGWELRTQEILDLTRLARTFRGIATAVITLETPHAQPHAPADALAADTLDGELRVREDLSADEGRAIRDILRRL